MSTYGNYDNFIALQLSDGSLVNCSIIDTAGQEKFRAMSQIYYKKADCCLLVYDITSQRSFEEIKNYYTKEIRDNCKEDIKVILLGNKTDKESSREVESEEGASLALENRYIFMESSCADNTNVADAFITLIENTNIEMKKKKKKNENEDENLKIEKNEKEVALQKRRCC